MQGSAIIASLTLGVIFGILFVFWPRESMPYIGPNTLSVCDGSDIALTYEPQLGSIKKGLPFVNQETIVFSPVCGHQTTRFNVKLMADFAIGLAAGGLLGNGAYTVAVSNRRKVKK